MAMNSHRLPGKGRRMRPIMGHKMYYRRIIITLQSGHYIPPLKKKKRFKSIYLIVW
jgi:large subunit ribosomal protein L23